MEKWKNVPEALLWKNGELLNEAKSRPFGEGYQQPEVIRLRAD